MGANETAPDDTLIHASARAHRWRRILEDGTYRSAAELTEAEGVTRSFVNRLLRLTLLAPDIVEAIIDGRQPRGFIANCMLQAVSESWEEQRRMWEFPAAS